MKKILIGVMSCLSTIGIGGLIYCKGRKDQEKTDEQYLNTLFEGMKFKEKMDKEIKKGIDEIFNKESE